MAMPPDAPIWNGLKSCAFAAGAAVAIAAAVASVERTIRFTITPLLSWMGRILVPGGKWQVANRPAHPGGTFRPSAGAGLHCCAQQRIDVLQIGLAELPRARRGVASHLFG